MSRTICVVTSTRAEYGLLRWVMQGIADAEGARLQTVVTGTHLAPEFGSTYQEIEHDGFHIDERVEMMVDGDTAVAVTKSMGLCLSGIADVLQRLAPDLLVVLGDRYEILAVAAAALVARVPVAHLHGGEATEGAFDDSIRHAVTKMSHLHFVAAEEYRRRVIQLGEHPERVFTVGGLGIDNLQRLPRLGRAELESALGFGLAAKNLLITYHPATLDDGTADRQMTELLAALEPLSETHLIFTMPNADPDHLAIREMIEAFVRTHPNARAYPSLGQLRYLSCIEHVDGVVGNSSSGLTEVPSFRKGTINIGDRQRGRLKAASVIDCAPDRTAIAAALTELYSPRFQAALQQVRNPYGEGGASARVVEVVTRHPLAGLIKKPFFDLPAEPQAVHP